MNDFQRLMTFGRRVTDDQVDAQYMFLAQRLDGLEEDWSLLQKMYENRSRALQQNVESQVCYNSCLIVLGILS